MKIFFVFKNIFWCVFVLGDESCKDPGEEKIYKCTLCPKAFVRKGCLKRHLIVHSDASPYQCYVCGKAFKMESYLVKHVKVHSDPYIYSCDVCEKSFKMKFYLINHMKQHNEDNIGETLNQNGQDLKLIKFKFKIPSYILI